jgi:hypothetical protein
LAYLICKYFLEIVIVFSILAYYNTRKGLLHTYNDTHLNSLSYLDNKRTLKQDSDTQRGFYSVGKKVCVFQFNENNLFIQLWSAYRKWNNKMWVSRLYSNNWWSGQNVLHFYVWRIEKGGELPNGENKKRKCKRQSLGVKGIAWVQRSRHSHKQITEI